MSTQCLLTGQKSLERVRNVFGGGSKGVQSPNKGFWDVRHVRNGLLYTPDLSSNPTKRTSNKFRTGNGGKKDAKEST